jgi:glycosyltransferase involved in cell wall biosynthesis
VKKSIIIRGPVLSQSGYGEQARFALRALRTREDLFDVFIQATPWGQTGWIWEQDDFREWIDDKIRITQIMLARKQLQPEMSLQIGIPNEWQKMCAINIGYTAGIETNRVAPVWLEKGNEMDKILVVSTHAKNTYESTVAQATNNETGETFPYKLNTPIEVVHERTPEHKPVKLDSIKLHHNFNFLCVSQMGPRKNFENTIKWFVEEFIDQRVGLVLKTSVRCNSIADYTHTQMSLRNILSNYPKRKCKVYLLHGDLSAGQMTSLYTNKKIKALVNIAHGEGFGLPLYEAARNALPVVTINWSGQTDFLCHDGNNYFQEVDYTVQPISEQTVWDGVLERGSMWAYADQGSFKMTLRKTKKDWKECKKTAEKLKTIVDDKFSEDRLYKGFVDGVLGFDSSLIEPPTDDQLVLEFD